MSEPRYVLTVYIAAPNTLLFDEKGRPQWEDGEMKYSLPGHVFYSISNDGDKTRQSYGFEPIPSGMMKPGHKAENDHLKYRNPAYERRIEITKEQYEALKNFGDNPDGHGFSTARYNAFNHSCIDFVHTALRYAKVHDAKVTLPGSRVEFGRKQVSTDGIPTVLPNKKIFNEIKEPFPNSELNRKIERPLPKAPNLKRVISNWFVGQEDNPERVLPSATQNPQLAAKDMAYQLLAAYTSNDPNALDIVKNHPYAELSIAETNKRVEAIKSEEEQMRIEQAKAAEAQVAEIEQPSRKIVRS